MILSVVYVLFMTLEGGWVAQGIAVVATVLMMRTKINPLILIAAGALVTVAASLMA